MLVAQRCIQVNYLEEFSEAPETLLIVYSNHQRIYVQLIVPLLYSVWPYQTHGVSIESTSVIGSCSGL